MARRKQTETFDPLTEVGGVGLKRSGGYVIEEFHPKLRGTKAMQVYREMYDNDAVVGAAFYAIDILLRGATWRTEPADESPRAQEVADFVDGCFDDMTNTHSDWMQEVLSCGPYGWARFEEVFKRRNGYNDDSGLSSRFKDGKLGISKLAFRAQDSLVRWQFGEHDKVLGMWQRPSTGAAEVFIPTRKSISFVVRGAKGSPEGRSMLRNGYRAWYMKKRLEEVEAIGLERDLGGFPVMEVPPELLKSTKDAATQASYDVFKSLVKGVRVDDQMGALVPSEFTKDGKPSQYRFRLMSAGSRNSAAVQAAIQRYDKLLAMTVLANFLFMGMDQVGSFSLHASATDLFAVGLGTILDTIEQEENRKLVPDLCRLNGFPQELWPKRKHGDVETIPLTEIATYINTLVGSGVLTPDEKLENHVRELAALPAMAEGEGTGHELDMLPDNVVPVVEPIDEPAPAA